MLLKFCIFFELQKYRIENKSLKKSHKEKKLKKQDFFQKSFRLNFLILRQRHVKIIKTDMAIKKKGGGGSMCNPSLSHPCPFSVIKCGNKIKKNKGFCDSKNSYRLHISKNV